MSVDIFKRQLAPLSGEAWKEVNDRAGQVLKNYLSARRVVNVVGPKGWEYSFLSEGRLDLIDTGSEVGAGLRKAKPLVELRIPFRLNRWELDNIDRGTADPDLGPLEEAARKIALFEENAIYNGFEAGMIKGLVKEAKTEPVSLGKKPEEIVKSLARAVQKLKDNFASGPFALVVNPETLAMLNSHVQGYPLVKRIESLLGTDIVVSRVLQGGLLLPKDHKDLEMIIGGDFEIGYHSHTDEEVELFIAESFTFRVLDPNIIVNIIVN